MITSTYASINGSMTFAPDEKYLNTFYKTKDFRMIIFVLLTANYYHNQNTNRLFNYIIGIHVPKNRCKKH